MRVGWLCHVMFTVYLLSRESSDLLCAVLDIDISLGLMTHVTLVTGEQGHNEGQRSTVQLVQLDLSTSCTTSSLCSVKG